ncbi:PKD domain-containing protein [Methanoplanus endosymbiosus]|uniref:PKD domain-containing protein n=1 Tax=Methanoplanus endosymbiosus TaxID=33865 RepID=A0A9E7PLH5_9EURY|nr:PKD domain-containing protein [Methanoplanus endosymbiosus]UUX91547.1 PKD domain-containing protein [Methanoplanus endosymbiosus]
MRICLIAALMLIVGLISPVCAAGPEPVSAFTASPVSGQDPLTVQFTDLSEGNPASWSWDFGDGATSTLQNPEHIYIDEGFFDVTLITTNAYGKSTGKKVKYIRVGIEPTASFTASNVSGTPPLTVVFTDYSSESPTSWEWDFGDGTTSVLQSPVHEYTASGTYDVSLIVESAVGTSYIIRDNYIKVGLSPVAAIGASVTSGDAPLEVSFTDLSSNNPDTWLWSFGDGYTSTEENPVHTYSRAGEYEVALTVENSFGSDRAVLGTKITAVEPGSPTPVPTSGPVNPPSPGPAIEPPVANFTGSPLSGDAPLSVSFFDRSKGGVTEWRWNFGDGKMSYESFPTHTYNYPGIYDVTLIIKNDDSGDSLTKTAYIKVTGSAPVNPDPTETNSPSPDKPTTTSTPGGYDPDNPYSNPDSSASGSGSGSASDGDDKAGNSTSGNSDEDDKTFWFWVPVFGFIFVILIAVVLYMWMQMYGGGGKDTL